MKNVFLLNTLFTVIMPFVLTKKISVYAVKTKSENCTLIIIHKQQNIEVKYIYIFILMYICIYIDIF